MSKARFLIITKEDLNSGFKLAGVEVLTSKGMDQTLEILRPLLDQSAPSLVAIEEDLFPIGNKKFMKHLEEQPFPVVVPLPKIDLKNIENQEKYVSELVRSCIGYYVKLK